MKRALTRRSVTRGATFIHGTEGLLNDLGLPVRPGWYYICIERTAEGPFQTRDDARAAAKLAADKEEKENEQGGVSPGPGPDTKELE